MKKKLIALVLLLAMVLTIGLVACKKDEETTPEVYKAATYGHNGLAFADITFEDNKITSLYLDEIEFSFFNEVNWFKNSAPVELAAGDLTTGWDAGTTFAKKIKIENRTFTYDSVKNAYVEDAATAGAATPLELYKSNNANKAKWTDELTLWVTNSIRAGQYWVLKADGTAADIPFTVSTTNKNTLEHDGDEVEFSYGAGAHTTEAVSKENRFVKSWTYYFRNNTEHKWATGATLPAAVKTYNVAGSPTAHPDGEDTRKAENVVAAAAGNYIHFYSDVINLSYDQNITAMVNFIMVTKNGTVPADYARTAATATAANDRTNPTSPAITAPNYWKYGGVSTAATFNDWNNYMLVVVKAVAIANA